MPYQARKLAAALGLKEGLIGQARQTDSRRLQNLVGLRRKSGRDQSAVPYLGRQRQAGPGCGGRQDVPR